MRVTLMTDASHCHTTNIAGFGFWVVSDRGRLAGGKVLKNTVSDSYEAEFKAVANSLKIGLDAGIISRGDCVLVQLDHKGVVNCITKQCKPRADLVDVLGYIFTFVRDNDLKLLCRHVKGHSSKQGKRFLANNHCDMHAKQAMRQMRREKGSEP